MKRYTILCLTALAVAFSTLEAEAQVFLPYGYGYGYGYPVVTPQSLYLHSQLARRQAERNLLLQQARNLGLNGPVAGQLQQALAAESFRDRLAHRQFHAGQAYGYGVGGTGYLNQFYGAARQTPFSGSPYGGNYYYWLSQQSGRLPDATVRALMYGGR